MDAFSKHCLNFFVCFFLKKNLLSLRHISQLYERKKAIVFWCYKFRHVSTCYDKFRHVTTGLHRFCLSFKDISQLFIFFRYFFRYFFFLVCIFANFFFLRDFIHVCSFVHSHCTKLFFSFHSFLWLHYICFFSYVLGSVIIIDWLVVGDFLFFSSLKVFCLLGNVLSF
jgi:hypothetical protein